MNRKIAAAFVCLTFFSIAPAQKLVIQKTLKPPVIDGVIDAKDSWLANNWVNVSKELGYSEIGKESEIGDMSAKFQLLHDEKNLYFAIQVQDHNRFTGNPTTYLNDCVVLFIAIDTNNIWDQDFDKAGNKKLLLQAAENSIIECGQIAPPSGIYKCTDNETYYIQEWSMPWDELTWGMDPPWDKQFFKLEIDVTNCNADGVRIQQQFWNDAEEYNIPWYPGGLVKLSNSLTNSIKSRELIFNVYPNPASNVLHISGTDNNTSIEIWNSIGVKLIATRNKEIDISSLINGIYFVRIQMGKEVVVKCFVKR
jgi:hypothetical protein